MTQKRTFRVQINRINNTPDPNKGAYIPILTNERIVIEFQATNTPIISKLEEIPQDPPSTGKATDFEPTTANLYRRFGARF